MSSEFKFFCGRDQGVYVTTHLQEVCLERIGRHWM